MSLYEQAIKAIRKLHGDTSVGMRETLDAKHWYSIAKSNLELFEKSQRTIAELRQQLDAATADAERWQRECAQVGNMYAAANAALAKAETKCERMSAVVEALAALDVDCDSANLQFVISKAQKELERK